MENKKNIAVTMFLLLDVLLFILVSACDTSPNPSPNISKPPLTPTVPSSPTPTIPAPIPTVPSPATPAIPSPRTSTSSTPYYYNGKFPHDALKLGVCANILHLVQVVVGSPQTLPCCSLIQGLVDLEAALCLCTAIRANVLGIDMNFPVALGLVLNIYGRKVPNDFECS